MSIIINSIDDVAYSTKQVTKETAESLMLENLSCSFRDVIDVKGKGMMSVFFVDLTSDLNLIEVKKGKLTEASKM